MQLDTYDALDLTRRARIVKTPAALDTFRRIGKIADQVIQAAADRLAAGVNWNGLQADGAFSTYETPLELLGPRGD